MHRTRQHPAALPDVCIAGAGIIGLTLALELHHRGARVTVLERGNAMTHASVAAAGMLAAGDPENPSQLEPLSARSVALYPEFLTSLEALSGQHVPFQTRLTLQAHTSYPVDLDPTLLPQLTPGSLHFRLLDEHSLDPRQLAAALLAAVRNTTIDLREHTALSSTTEDPTSIHLQTTAGTFTTTHLVSTLGAWSIAPVIPRKGQMLTVALPASLPLTTVVRTPQIYIVPRTTGPRAGLALIGATVEEAGFDITTSPADLASLRAQAAALLPQLADESLCPTVDQWAGLRPATPDALPILGPLYPGSRHLLATGHYRNGILLAPATARLMAQLLMGEKPDVDLTPFTPARFTETV